jgi:hypothetical protein
MIQCRCCGEIKQGKEFYKINVWYDFSNQDAQWCRQCQKMYCDMKRQELTKKKFKEIVLEGKLKIGRFNVDFS